MNNKNNIQTDKYSSNLVELILDKMNKQELELIRLRDEVCMKNSSQEPEQFYTIEETTKILKMSRRSLYDARKRGDIHWREYDGLIRFSKYDIEEFQLKCRR